MRILFIGAVEYSFHMLIKLKELDADIVGVVTKKKSKFNSDFHDLVPLCKQNNLLYHYTKDINSQVTVNWIRRREPDIIFCFGWSQLITRELLDIPEMGIMGYHPTSLPYNRGRHPLIWTLALGLDKTSSTFFIMKEGADTGDIISQVPVKISKKDDAYSLYNKLICVSKKQIEHLLPSLASKKYKLIVQNMKNGNSWRKRNQNDGKIDWRMSAQSIHNLVRSLTYPYVGAHFEYAGLEIKVWNTSIGGEVPNNVEPGKIVAIINGVPKVKCGTGTILIKNFTPIITFKKGDYL